MYQVTRSRRRRESKLNRVTERGREGSRAELTRRPFVAPSPSLTNLLSALLDEEDDIMVGRKRGESLIVRKCSGTRERCGPVFMVTPQNFFCGASPCFVLPSVTGRADEDLVLARPLPT